MRRNSLILILLLLIAAAIIDRLEVIDPKFPKLNEDELRNLAALRAALG